MLGKAIRETLGLFILAGPFPSHKRTPGPIPRSPALSSVVGALHTLGVQAATKEEPCRFAFGPCRPISHSLR